MAELRLFGWFVGLEGAFRRSRGGNDVGRSILGVWWLLGDGVGVMSGWGIVLHYFDLLDFLAFGAGRFAYNLVIFSGGHKARAVHLGVSMLPFAIFAALIRITAISAFLPLEAVLALFGVRCKI